MLLSYLRFPVVSGSGRRDSNYYSCLFTDHLALNIMAFSEAILHPGSAWKSAVFKNIDTQHRCPFSVPTSKVGSQLLFQALAWSVCHSQEFLLATWSYAYQPGQSSVNVERFQWREAFNTKFHISMFGPWRFCPPHLQERPQRDVAH